MKVVHNTHYVSFTPRLVATLIDSVIWIIPWVWLLSRWSSRQNLEDLAVQVITDVVWLVIPLGLIQGLYGPVMLSRWSATIGKMVVGIKVEDEDKKTISIKRALFREWVAKPLNSVMLNLPYLLILVNDKHQGIHDQLADTYVYPNNPRFVMGVLILFMLVALIGLLGWQVIQGFLNNTSLIHNSSEVFLLNLAI